MDKTTVLLSAAARFTSAVALLCLSPLLPILSLSLNFPEESKPALLSEYSSGYLLTQMGGTYLADKHGYATIVATTVGLSALILFYISTFATTVITWTRAFFCLGLVAGPLFPAGSASISSNVRVVRRAASFAIVDASASAGTTVASLAPIVAHYMGWRFIYKFAGMYLLLASLGIISSMQSNYLAKNVSSSLALLIIQTSKHPKYDKHSDIRSLVAVRAIFLPVAVCTYFCHCCDDFTKYSINSWAATMLYNTHETSPAIVSGILPG
jgi:MFS family permease